MRGEKREEEDGGEGCGVHRWFPVGGEEEEEERVERIESGRSGFCRGALLGGRGSEGRNRDERERRVGLPEIMVRGEVRRRLPEVMVVQRLCFHGETGEGKGGVGTAAAGLGRGKMKMLTR
ncbi:hypothetical protein HAX54_034429, partial [Datura stramonium]|nr:hypothetical protein [Datura stramonium]